VYTSAHPRSVRSCILEGSTLRLSAIWLIVIVALALLVVGAAVTWLLAAHESSCTTKLYDRTSDVITLDEVEWIKI
jgi:hypothetical protein